jgi:hypothetical protein
MKKEKKITNFLDMVYQDGNINDLPKYFFDKDTIFHYTKAKTAVDKILKFNKLKLSRRLKSIDPMENCSPSVYSESCGPIAFQNSSPDVSKVEKLFLKQYRSLKQLCFCYNKNNHLGCLKPRMWDQYGEQYQGVCLVFSKKLIQTYSGLNFKKISYYPFSEILGRKVVINENELDFDGKEKYYKDLLKKYEFLNFQKHQDYVHENEIRLFSYSKDHNPLFNFKDSLKAIVMNLSPKNSYIKKYYQQILEYSQTNNIDFISLNWDFDGFYVHVINKAK